MKILILGICYKANSNDIRRSQAIVLYNELKKVNKNIAIYAPFVKSESIKLIKKADFSKLFVKQI